MSFHHLWKLPRRSQLESFVFGLIYFLLNPPCCTLPTMVHVGLSRLPSLTRDDRTQKLPRVLHSDSCVCCRLLPMVNVGIPHCHPSPTMGRVELTRGSSLTRVISSSSGETTVGITFSLSFVWSHLLLSASSLPSFTNERSCLAEHAFALC